MQKNDIYKLYGFGGGAFLLALTKYFFAGNAAINPKFFVFEFISFGLFLGLVYFSDRCMRESNKQKQAEQLQNRNIKAQQEQEIERLQKTIVALKGSEQNQGNNEDGQLNRVTERMMDGLKNKDDKNQLAKQLLNNMAAIYEVGLAVCYFYDKPSEKFTVKATYGLATDLCPSDFVAGEGLNGQAAADKEYRMVADVPEDYFGIESGSGQSKPHNIYLLPIVKDNNCIGLIEMASFAKADLHKQWSHLSKRIASVMEF